MKKYSLCINEIVQKSNGTFSEKDAKDLLNDIDKVVKRKVRDTGEPEESALKSVVQERAAEALESRIKQQANMLNNALVLNHTLNKVDEFVDKGFTVSEAFIGILVGSEKNVSGSKDYIALRERAIATSSLNSLTASMMKDNLMEIFQKNLMKNDLAAELFYISSGLKGVATKNSKAQAMAKIVHEHLDELRLRQNEKGADIRTVSEWLGMHQRHDIAAMQKSGRDKWIATVKPLLDTKRSFDGADDIDKALMAAYDAMITGVRFGTDEMDVKLFQFSGPANLAKRISRSRKLIFKDSESFLTYNEQYGFKDLNSGIVAAMLDGSKNVALMERLGTNPEAMLDTAIVAATRKHREKMAKGGEREVKEVVDKYMQQVTGRADGVGAEMSSLVTQLSANLRALNNLTMLGGTGILSFFTDTPLKFFEFRFQGKGFLSSASEAFKSKMALFQTKEEVQKFNSLVNCYTESMIADIAGRYAGPETLGKRMAGLQRLFFKLNFLAPLTDADKRATKITMAHDLALKKDTTFDELDEATSRLFSQYNITKSDWDAIRKATIKEGDREYVDAQLIKSTEVKEKLTGYYLDRSDYATLTPTAKEKAILTRGTRKGDYLGEALRFVTQYKAFPTTMITKVWGRALYGKGKADIPAMIELVLFTTVMGYIADTAIGYMKGKNPQDPTDINVFLKAASKGGGLGILGDFFLQEYNKYGINLAEGLTGPTVGRAGDISVIVAKLLRGEDAMADLLKVGIGFVPANNLIYIRPTIDQMFLYRMQEELSAGYLARKEARERAAGTKYWMRPTDALR